HSPLACQASTLSRPLHTYQFFLAQSCRTLLCSTDRETDSPGRPSQRARIGNGDQELSRRHQRIAQAFRLDQKRGRNPRQRRTLLCADFWVRILEAAHRAGKFFWSFSSTASARPESIDSAAAPTAE